MTLPLKTISGLTSDMVAVWAAQTDTAPTFSDGDVLLAFWQSVASQLDFLQAQIQAVVFMSRAQTATGADLDSWMAQFNFVRLGSTFAAGQEQFIKLQPSSTQVVVPIETVVQTVGGGITYQVVADATQSAYSSTAGGYVLAAGQTVVTATIQAVVGGSASNVLTNTLVQFGSSLPGIDQVTNPAPISDGVDGESDAAFRSRFVLYLATLAKATEAAIRAAATGVQQGLSISLLENTTPAGTTQPGSFTVVADDGSGDPPASLLSSIFSAVDAVRAFSVQPFVTAPSAVQAVIVLSIHLDSTAVAVLVNVAVQNAVATAVNSLSPGDTLYASSIIIAAAGVAGVASVNPASVAINGLSADLAAATGQEIRTSLASISVTNY
jgi:uncharacterized phage protein gp47/JayE